MKKALPLLLLTICLHGYAHLKYIRIEKINTTGQYDKEIHFISDNLGYYDHWSPDWSYPIKEDSLIKELTRCYTLFEKSPADNPETDLLLGEVAHYLYNMNVQAYYEKADSHYQKAIRLGENDYRGYWFLANHYASSAVQDQSVIFFEKAEKLLPADAPADFWAEYGYAMLLANMISHCTMALDNARKISGGSKYITELDKMLQIHWQSIDADSAYQTEDIWGVADKGKLITLVSRALGTKINIDTTWGVQFRPYDKHQTAIVLKPGEALSKNGKKIGYSIALLFKVAAPDETLDSYVTGIVGRQGKLTPEPSIVPYKNTIGYSIINKEMYPQIGGGHFHVIGIERAAPAYPGLLLEKAQILPKGDEGKVNVYRAGAQRRRMPGRIFYMILLDTCEDIHEASYDVFRQLVQDHLVIE